MDHLPEGETFFIPPMSRTLPSARRTRWDCIERRLPRREGTRHLLLRDCGALVEDIDFDCGDIVQHFSQAMLDFWNDDARRTAEMGKSRAPGPTKPF